MFQVLDVFNTVGSPLQLRLHLHSFMNIPHREVALLLPIAWLHRLFPPWNLGVSLDGSVTLITDMLSQKGPRDDAKS